MSVMGILLRVRHRAYITAEWLEWKLSTTKPEILDGPPKRVRGDLYPCPNHAYCWRRWSPRDCGA